MLFQKNKINIQEFKSKSSMEPEKNKLNGFFFIAGKTSCKILYFQSENYKKTIFFLFYSLVFSGKRVIIYKKETIP